MTAEQHTQLKELDGFGWRRKVTWVPDPGDTLQSSSKSVNYFLLNIFLWNDDGTKRFPLRPLVDTGAGDLFINLLQAEALGCNIKPYEGHELFAANDKPLDVRGQIRQSWYPEDGTQALCELKLHLSLRGRSVLIMPLGQGITSS